jgi:hypothetical protein
MVILVHPPRQADIVGINAMLYYRFYSKQK